MRISLIKQNRIKNMILPEKISGSFWFSDFDVNGIEQNLVSIEAVDGKWQLNSNQDVFITRSDMLYVENSVLEPYKFYTLRDKINNRILTLYCSPSYDNNVFYYNALSFGKQEISIGKNQNCDLVYNQPGVNEIHAKIIMGNNVSIKDNITQSGTYVNNIRINGTQEIETGDVIFIMGLKIIYLIFNNQHYFLVNNPNNLLSSEAISGNPTEGLNLSFNEPNEDIEMTVYKPEEYFHRKPRFIYSVKALDLNIEAPPKKIEEKDSPMILTIGPMITMSMTSLMSVYMSISNMTRNASNWKQAIPSMVIGVAMLASVFVWPTLVRNFQKKERTKAEKKRKEEYVKYIREKIEKIGAEVNVQRNAVINGNPSLSECQNIILNRQTNLWERRREDEDFLKVSVGNGTVPMNINIRYPEEDFTMEEDGLKDIMLELGRERKVLENVPIPISFMENNISGIIGINRLNMKEIENILLQMMTFHSYDDLKIAVFTNQEQSSAWKFLKTLPHTWSNDRSNHYFATKNDEYKELCYNLGSVFTARKEETSASSSNVKIYRPYYLIITDSFKAIRGFDFIKNLVEDKDNCGFSLIILSPQISDLPDQCRTFLKIDNNGGQLIKNVALNDAQTFGIEYTKINLVKLAKILSHIPIEFTNETDGKIPNKVGFLEMYDVGKVEHLNSMNRWMKNVPILNMQTPVGVGKSGEKIVLDLHEKYHGPHGLIAGMTGSGKSEFIITYILSMAINYHPYEVQFILIDYKGGGLAGAFENITKGLKLPHLVGTITNLDTNEIKRSLVSIDSELKRRQRLFNQAREISGESTVDIYKYQKMYRDKLVKEPVSHLFIIADEFAELKTQQPEFMEHLISTARIGRSLGVHLILATQKPSGVVDPQIWSNTRFRVCFRVQEKSDSNEVIKNPDAALLKQVGRFYMQVGFNEIFVLGQAAWAGGQYYPSEKISRPIDSTTIFVDNLGYPIKSIDNKVKKEASATMGEELVNILSYICGIASRENIKTRPLWLEKIPKEIFVDNLVKKYNYTPKKFVLNPVIGEYDVPNMQAQHLLTIPFTKEGNAIVYGISGAGKENFIMTLLYSSLISHDSSEVNYYILDFGAEVLKSFESAPIVGDTVYVGDNEKVGNLYKLLMSTIESRKKLFAEYNGDYQTYCQKSGSSVPNIVVIINNFNAYQETYPDFDDILAVITRDCTKYGIYFLLTAVNPNGIRFKLKQNFAQIFALQQNSLEDYSTVLGNVNKTYPSKDFGRGILRREGVNEFQTALVAEREEISNFVKEKIKSLVGLDTMYATKIPVLPEIVTSQNIKNYSGSTEDIIIGIDKEALRPVGFSLKRNLINVISSEDSAIFPGFINPFINQIISGGKYQLLIINCDDLELEEESKKYYQYIDNNFEEVFNKLMEHIKRYKEEYIKNNKNKAIFNNVKPMLCIINGVEAFKNKLNDDEKLNFGNLFDECRDLGIFKFIFIDSIDKIKKIEIESWFKSNTNLSDGIWLGNGINDQFTMKTSSRIPSMKESIPNNFAFVIKKGKPTLVKYVEKFEIQLNKNK